MKIAKATTMDRLRAASLPIMVAYQTDLEHDADWLLDHPGEPFIHICTDTSTHIFPCPMGYGDNEMQRYLFGRCTPRDIYRGYLKCIEMLAKRDPCRIHYFDGQRLVLLSVAAAVKFYKQYLESSERRLELLRKAG